MIFNGEGGGGGGILKKCNIRRDEVSNYVMRITFITPLKSQVTHEDTLHGFGLEDMRGR